ncbi:MAG: aldose 1-epimerase [Parcubacteria group bacterium]|nr:aldose 1-epimerase [Parcubacteria group bacterium]
MAPLATTYQDEKLGTIASLKSGALSAEIAVDCGSNLISLKTDERELIHTNREALLEHAYTGCFVLYPFPNRIRDRKFTFENTSYSLENYPKRVDDNALIHGLAHDAEWNIDGVPTVEGDTALVTTSMHWDSSQEYFDVFPVPSKLTLTYRLSELGLRIEYLVTNTSDKRMPFGFALHPSFKRLSGDETMLTLPANQVMRMDKDLLPTNELLDLDLVMFRQFDLRKPVPVNAALRLDHVFTDLIPDEPAVISYPTENLEVSIRASADCKFIVLHTLGKDRTIEIEPQTCSTDAVNANDPGANGLLTLEPEATHVGFIEYSVKNT